MQIFFLMRKMNQVEEIQSPRLQLDMIQAIVIVIVIVIVTVTVTVTLTVILEDTDKGSMMPRRRIQVMVTATTIIYYNIQVI